jgi:NitT/TauT family transport system substrate-binding protein
MKRRTATMLLGSALALAPAVARAKDKITVIMSGWDLLFWGTLAASELGYFDAEGIDAEMVRAGGGAKSLAAVAGGNAEFNIGAPASAFRARAKGSDVMMIAPAIAQYTDNVTMSGAWAKKHGLTATSSYEDKLKALKGMTLAVSSIGGGADQLVRFLSKQAGLDAEVKPLDGFVYIGIIARESWLKRNRELTIRFLRAEQRGLDAIHDPALTDKARDLIHAKYFPSTGKELFDLVWRNARASYPRTIALDASMIARIVDFVNMTQPDPLDAKQTESAWTNEYAAAALASMKRGP